jgi:hypothetical protein
MTPEIELVLKENLGTVHFVSTEVLTTPEERRLRLANLEKAVILGDGYKGKVRIIFETTEGSKAVETTIWQAAEDTILLKGGVRIPIHSIREVMI